MTPAYCLSCRHRRCLDDRRAAWWALSVPQQRLLCALAYGPRTWADLAAHRDVRRNTIQATIRAGLIVQRNLSVAGLARSPMLEFLAITPLGHALVVAAGFARRIAA